VKDNLFVLFFNPKFNNQYRKLKYYNIFVSLFYASTRNRRWPSAGIFITNAVVAELIEWKIHSLVPPRNVMILPGLHQYLSLDLIHEYFSWTRRQKLTLLCLIAYIFAKQLMAAKSARSRRRTPATYWIQWCSWQSLWIIVSITAFCSSNHQSAYFYF
jgi:hypothetical protein